MKTCIALAIAVASGAPAGCSRPSARAFEDADVPVCVAHTCKSIGGPSGAYITGTTVSVLSFESPCRFEASWGIAEAAEDSFRATFDAREGEVFALHGRLVQLYDCHGVVIHKDGHASPPGADVFLDPPDQAWAGPAPENVVIPLLGDATLDGDAVAHATLERPDGALPESVTVSVADAMRPPSVHRNLRPLDEFTWGRHRASIVRVVAPDARLVGWVEARLL